MEERLRSGALTLFALSCFLAANTIISIIYAGWASFNAIAYSLLLMLAVFVWSHELPFVHNGSEPHAPHFNACIAPLGLGLAIILLSPEESLMLAAILTLLLMPCFLAGIAVWFMEIFEQSNR